MNEKFRLILRLIVYLGGEGIFHPKKECFSRELFLPFNPLLLLLDGSNIKLSLENASYKGSIIPAPQMIAVEWDENTGIYTAVAEITYQKKEEFNFITEKIPTDKRYTPISVD